MTQGPRLPFLPVLSAEQMVARALAASQCTPEQMLSPGLLELPCP